MDDKNVIKIINEDGNEQEYEILMLFRLEKTKNNYIIYTDNSKDEDGNLMVLASIYNEDNGVRLDPIETEEEWDEVEKLLNKMSKE